jgi:IS605 OrfB family transposase
MKTRNVVHGEVWFNNEDAEIINRMVRNFSSAVRSGYQAKHKHKLKGNDITKYIKNNYMRLLNQRYINDAVMVSGMINQDNALFGGKRNWKKLQTKTITKQEWLNSRNNQLYSRGDVTKKGNPNMRIVGNELWVNDPSAIGKWVKGKLYLQKNVDLSCYDVRLIKKDNNKFSVTVSYENEIADMSFNDKNGVIGIDTNPDGIAVVETDYNGNLLSHQYIKKERIQFAEEGKRDNDIRLLAKEVVIIAKSKNKPIVIEQLNFKQRKSYKKFNRIKSNFLYRKIIEAIQSRAIKDGVAVKEVHSAFTSILGQLKYQKMYSLNRHTSAGLVIGRRGLGIKEKQTFIVKDKTDKKEKSDKDKLNLEGRDLSIDMTRKAWSWLQEGFLKTKSATLTGSCLVPPKEAYSTSIGETPMGEPTTTTGRCGINKINQDAEGHPCKIFQSY